MGHREEVVVGKEAERRDIVNGTMKLTNQGLCGQLPGWILNDPKIAGAIKVLLLNKNGFAAIPLMTKLTKCEKLVLSNNCVTELPAGVLPPSITSLELVNNSLANFDLAAIKELPRLAFLDICANQLDDDTLQAAIPACLPEHACLLTRRLSPAVKMSVEWLRFSKNAA